MSVLHPFVVFPGQPDYDALLSWPFPQTPFYATQVLDLLRAHVPHRFVHGNCSIWLYRDTHGEVVGFGSLDISDDYHLLTGGLDHAYIPVLGVHPHHGGKGYGKWIVDHLFAEAVMLRAQEPTLADSLFLDVYQANQQAIGLYANRQFSVPTTANPVPDPAQNNEPYLVMARKLA